MDKYCCFCAVKRGQDMLFHSLCHNASFCKFEKHSKIWNGSSSFIVKKKTDDFILLNIGVAYTKCDYISFNLLSRNRPFYKSIIPRAILLPRCRCNWDYFCISTYFVAFLKKQSLLQRKTINRVFSLPDLQHRWARADLHSDTTRPWHYDEKGYCQIHLWMQKES